MWTCRVGREVKGEKKREIRIDTYTPPCVKEIASGKLL